MSQQLDELDGTAASSPWIRGVVRARWIVIAAFGLLCACLLPGLARLGVDNRPEVFFPADDEALERYARLNRRFGGDRAVRIVASAEGAWDPERLDWLGRFEAQVARLPGVGLAVGVPGLHRWHLDGWPPAEGFMRAALPDPLHRSASFLSRDGRRTSVLVGLMPLVPEGNRLVLERLEALAGAAPPGVRVRVGGLPVVARALDDSVREVITGIFPLIGAAVLLLVFVLVRSVLDCVVPMLFVGVCLGVMFGAMGWLGVTLNIVVSVVAPLVFVIALASSVHVLLGFRGLQHAGVETSEAVRRVYAEKGWAVFWTCATTGLAFGSLLAARVPPIRAMGLWSAAGLGFAALSAFTLYPALLAALAGRPRRQSRFERLCHARGPQLAELAIGRRRAIGIGSALLLLGAFLGISRLQFDSSILRYFAPEHPLRSDLESFEAAGLPAATADVVLHERRAPPALRAGDALARLDGLARELEEEPLVFGAVSAGSLVSAARRWAGEAGDLPDVVERLEADPTLRLLLGTLVTPDGSSARIVTTLPMRGYQELDPTLERAVATARRWFPDAEVELTGQYPLILSAQRDMFRTLAVSLSATCVGVVLLLLLVVRDVRVTLRALFPNLLPVIVLLGAVGASGVPLNSATVTVPAVALGLAVDDTLHTLAYFRRLAPQRGARRAIQETLGITAGGHVMTALVLAAGFLLLGTAELRPVAQFGLLLGAGVGLALLGDLVLIPALLAHRDLASPDGDRR